MWRVHDEVASTSVAEFLAFLCQPVPLHTLRADRVLHEQLATVCELIEFTVPRSRTCHCYRSAATKDANRNVALLG